MLPRWRRIPLLAIALLGAAQAADPDAGKALYGACVACHGESAEGNAALSSPALAGQSAAYLTRELHFFKTAVRGAA